MDPRRMITTRIWADAWFEELDSESKLLWLYLLTNQQTNLIGIYEISIRRISNETGINSNRLETLLDGFANRSKIIWTGSYMVICNFLKHQNLANPNMEKAALKIFDTLPDSIKKVLLSHGINDFKSFLNGFGNPSETHPDGLGEREREREREREIESETESGKSATEFSAEQLFLSPAALILENKKEQGKPPTKHIKETQDIPTQEEFLAYAKSWMDEHQKDFNGKRVQIISKYQTWVANKWRDGNNKQIKNWKLTFQNTEPYLKSDYGKNYSNSSRTARDAREPQSGKSFGSL